MIERTEELGLAARLTIVVGGQPVQLRTLNLEESEQWQAVAAALVSKFDVPEKGNASDLFTAFAHQPSTVMFDLVVAYDVDGLLGSPAALRKRFTQLELYAAVKQMARAELPFLTDARSVVEAFGPQLRMLAWPVAQAISNQFLQASSTNGASPTGDSTPQPSDDSSPRNGSSSSGPTDSSESDAKPKRRPSSQKSLVPTPISTPP